MASTQKEEDSGFGISDISNIAGLGSKVASALSGLGSVGTAGQTLASIGIPAGDVAALSAMPSSGLNSILGGTGGLGTVLALAAFNLYNMFADKERPSVWFSSGDSPQYVWNGTKPVGQFSEYPGETQNWIKSEKYGYYIATNDIEGTDAAQAMIDTFDQTFDELAASGVNVNDMLARNSDFAFAGGLMDGMTPDKLYEGVIEYFSPEIEAYQAGATPSERDVTIYPTGGYVDPKTNQRVAGRDAYDMGLVEGPYHVTVDGGSGSDSSENKTNDPNKDGVYSDLSYKITQSEDGTYVDQDGNPISDETLAMLKEFGLLAEANGVSGGSESGIPTAGGNSFAGAVDLTSGGINMPDTIPENLQPGLESFVTGSQQITDNYSQSAQDLWNDYLEFEDTYFNKYETTQNQYQDNLGSMPQMTMTLPDTLGGGTVGLAPTAHSAMYTDQFNAMNNSIGNQANASLAGMGSRNSIMQNMYNTNMQNLNNSFMPTQVGLDLYNMERAGELGISQAEAGKYEPSTVSTWAPVVGSILGSDFATDIIGDGLSSAWDTISGWLA